MDRADLHSRLAAIAGSVFACAPNLFHDATRAPDIARWDSFNHVKFLVTIEDEFGLRFSNDDIQVPRNWGEMVDMIAKRHAENPHL